MKRTLPLKAAYAFGAKHNLQREVTEIREMPFQSHEARRSSVRRGHIINLFERNRIFEDFKRDYWPFGNKEREGKTRRDYYVGLASKRALVRYRKNLPVA